MEGNKLPIITERTDEPNLAGAVLEPDGGEASATVDCGNQSAALEDSLAGTIFQGNRTRL